MGDEVAQEGSAMLRTMVKSRVLGAVPTAADDIDPGSVVLDADLLDAADLLEGERVLVVAADGTRTEAHARVGERGSGAVGIDGAHLPPGPVSLVSYGMFDELEARALRPRTVAVDAANRVVEDASESLVVPAEPGGEAETDDAARLDALLQPPEK